MMMDPVEEEKLSTTLTAMNNTEEDGVERDQQSNFAEQRDKTVGGAQAPVLSPSSQSFDTHSGLSPSAAQCSGVMPLTVGASRSPPNFTNQESMHLLPSASIQFRRMRGVDAKAQI
jgi:hypothetical protein